MSEPNGMSNARRQVGMAALGLLTTAVGMFALAEQPLTRYIVPQLAHRLADPPAEAWACGPDFTVGFACTETTIAGPQLAEPRWSPLATPLKLCPAGRSSGHASTPAGRRRLPATATLAAWHVRLQV